MARSHFDQLEDAVQKDFVRLKEAFMTRFESGKTSENQRLVSRHQSVGEPVGEFDERVCKPVLAATVGKHHEVRKRTRDWLILRTGPVNPQALLL